MSYSRPARTHDNFGTIFEIKKDLEGEFSEVFLLVAICLLSNQITFAKNTKLNSKTGAVVYSEDQFNPQVTLACENCNREIMQACQRYTSTYSNEGLCIGLRSDPEVTKGCYYNTSKYSLEADCLRKQISPEIAQGCKTYTSTYSNESLCIELRISPYDAETCKRYTSTYSAEAECLRACAQRNVEKSSR